MKKLDIYKCNECWNVIEILSVWWWDIICCWNKMSILNEQSLDKWNEKHTPIYETTQSWINVKIWSIPHPMEKKHNIERVEIITSWNSYRKFLNINKLPEINFEIKEENFKIRSYCNLHWLWKTEK